VLHNKLLTKTLKKGNKIRVRDKKIGFGLAGVRQALPAVQRLGDD
jgi:hypothetical protein